MIAVIKADGADSRHAVQLVSLSVLPYSEGDSCLVRVGSGLPAAEEDLSASSWSDAHDICSHDVGKIVRRKLSCMNLMSDKCRAWLNDTIKLVVTSSVVWFSGVIVVF